MSGVLQDYDEYYGLPAGTLEGVYQAESSSGTNPAANVAAPGSTIVGPLQQSLGFQEQYGYPGEGEVDTDLADQANAAGSYLSAAMSQGASLTQALYGYNNSTGNPAAAVNYPDTLSSLPQSYQTAFANNPATGAGDTTPLSPADAVSQQALNNTAATEAGTGQGGDPNQVPDAATALGQVAGGAVSWVQGLLANIENFAERGGAFLVALVIGGIAIYALTRGQGAGKTTVQLVNASKKGLSRVATAAAG